MPREAESTVREHHNRHTAEREREHHNRHTAVYDRHNEVVQTTSALFKLESLAWPQALWLNQLCGQQLYRCRHLRPRNSARPTDGQVWGSPLTQKRVAFDMSIVDPNAPTGHSGTGPGACSQKLRSFLNRDANALRDQIRREDEN